MYHKLGYPAERRVRRRLAELNRKIETVTEEIEHLSLIRDNRLKYSVYKPFVDRKLAEKTRNKNRRENAERDGVSRTAAGARWPATATHSYHVVTLTFVETFDYSWKIYRRVIVCSAFAYRLRWKINCTLSRLVPTLRNARSTYEVWSKKFRNFWICARTEGRRNFLVVSAINVTRVTWFFYLSL